MGSPQYAFYRALPRHHLPHADGDDMPGASILLRLTPE